MLLGILLLAPRTAPAHGQTPGTVCIIPNDSGPCPSTPASITGRVGTQLKVSLFIQGSDNIAGFDVTLLADHTILKPAAVDLNGTILPGPQSIVDECLGNVLIIGSLCSPTDNLDTLHFTAVACHGCLSFATSGLLFHAIYNVTGNSSGTSLGFQTGCGTTTSHPPTCVTISAGAIVPLSENVQTATFSTSLTPDFSLSANPASQTVQAGSTATSQIIVASINGFSGTVSLTLPAVCLALGCPTWSINPNTVSVPPGGAASSFLTFAASPQTMGTWRVPVTGTSSNLVHNVTATFIVSGFSISSAPSSLTIAQGSCANSAITVTSVNGFSGTVSLSSMVSPPGPTASLNPATLVVPSGGSSSATLTVCASTATPAGSYTIIVTGTSGAMLRSTNVSITVSAPPDFTITAIPASQTIERGTSASFTITIKGTNGFNNTVNLATTISPISPHGPTTSLPSIAGPYSTSTLTVSTTHNTALGTYTIIVTATSGSLSHSASVSVTVTH